MSNESFRGAWLAQFGSSQPKIVCVGQNYVSYNATRTSGRVS
jgi:hypothetical protein